MWPESSSLNAANLVKKSTAMPEIQNFSYGITLLYDHGISTSQTDGGRDGLSDGRIAMALPRSA